MSDSTTNDATNTNLARGTRSRPSKRGRENDTGRSSKRMRYGPDTQQTAAYLGQLAQALGVPVPDIPGVDDTIQALDQMFRPSDEELAQPSEQEELDPRRLAAVVAPEEDESMDSDSMEEEADPFELPPLDEETLKALSEQASMFRAEARKTVKLADRKPTFYSYMQADAGVGMGRLFSATPSTQRAQTVDPDPGSEFSLQDIDVGPVPGKPPRGRAPDVNRDRITKTAQGPHTLAHVLVEEMLKTSVPSTGGTARERWNTLEQTFVSQVDPPDRFLQAVLGEIDVDLDSDDEQARRVKFALQRHQELFNRLEAAFNEAGAELMLAEQGKHGDPGSKTYEAWTKNEAGMFDYTRNLLGEIMELAPFGSYSWHGRGASSAELGGKGERREGFLNARRELDAARGDPERWPGALKAMAAELAKLVDKFGNFEDGEAYRAFLQVRLELAGSPEDSDTLLKLVLGGKG